MCMFEKVPCQEFSTRAPPLDPSVRRWLRQFPNFRYDLSLPGFRQRKEAMQSLAADQANQRMVDRMIAEGALWSPALIAAFRVTPRHKFLEHVFQYHKNSEEWREIQTRDPTPENLDLIYSDRALITRLTSPSHEGVRLPISSSSQPTLMARMLEDLQLQPGQRVLEIGAGTGYDAALLAHVVGPECVTSVDVDREVLSEASDHLRAFPERRVSLRHADGRSGCPDAAPFDRMIVTAATADLQPAWLQQLVDDGLLLAPMTLAPGLEFLVRGGVERGVFHGRLLRAAYFMPLRAEAESGAGPFEPFSAMSKMRSVPAPWAGWFDRKSGRGTWLNFIHSLVFFGLVHGLTIHYRTHYNGAPVYAVADPHLESLCWLGEDEWQVSAAAGLELGSSLWRDFLAAGGPWPTEFRLTAVPHAQLAPTFPTGYREQGVFCTRNWQLIEPRQRTGWQ